MEISLAPSFIRAFESLSKPLKEEASEKISLLADPKNHQLLKVHKLTGRLKQCYAFSVNYKTRIIFQYIGKPHRAYLMTIGDHDVYSD